jgi:hypothetical protein
MLTRAVALIVVLTLAGPSLAVAACELTCAHASHHDAASPSSEASCHEQESPAQDVGVGAIASAPCHMEHGLPLAIIDIAFGGGTVSLPPSALVVSPSASFHLSERSAPDRPSAPPRSAHRPLRV